MFKQILRTIEKASDFIYKVFYDLKVPKVGYFLTTPLYLAERLTCFVWSITKNTH